MLPFSYVHDHLKPALELLRRDLLARADIDLLNESLTARDKDLELLLSVTGSHPQASGSDDLQSLLANAASHLKCVLAGIVVPDKGLVLTYPDDRRRQHPHAHAAPAARHHADAPRSAGDQPDRDAGRPGRHSRIASSPARCARASAAPRACSRCSASSKRRNSSAATCTWPTCWRARSRPASKPVTTRCPGLLTRAALEQRVKLMFTEARRARAALEPAVRRHRRAARHQRKLRHARGRPGHRADRRAAAQTPAAELRRGAHLRRSLRGRHALGHRRGGDVRRRPARGRHAPIYRAASTRVSVCPSASASRRSAAATAISAVRSPRPNPPARRPRTAAATASRPSRKTTSASSAGSPTSTWPPTCAPRSPRTACGSKRR